MILAAVPPLLRRAALRYFGQNIFHLADELASGLRAAGCVVGIGIEKRPHSVRHGSQRRVALFAKFISDGS